MGRKVNTPGSDLSFKSAIERALHALYKRRKELQRLIEQLESTSPQRLQRAPRKLGKDQP
jgi:antitoxin component of MazEF toxin-antitoxin module